MPSLETAPVADISAWVLTDGKAGDEGQCLAVAEALDLSADIRRVAPRAPYVWAMPTGPIDPWEGADVPGSPIAPPFPDLLLASGRRSVPYVRAVRRLSGGRTYTVILKNPRTGKGAADLIWVPAHDRLRGANVVATLTSPHRISQRRLEAARRDTDPRLLSLPSPRAAVLVGGDSRRVPFTPADQRRLLEGLARMAESGVSLAITASRRTPVALRHGLATLAAETGSFFWAGDGVNPYAAMLALADAVVVTADSVNMISEAAATGVPVLLFELTRNAPRHAAFVAELMRRGVLRPFNGTLERYTYEPLDSTPVIAEAIRAGLAKHRAGFGSG